jgi:hypothetical protein
MPRYDERAGYTKYIRPPRKKVGCILKKLG